VAISTVRESALVEMATEAKRPTRWWLAYLVAVGGVFLIIFSLASWAITAVVQPAAGSIGAQLVETGSFLAVFGALALWVRFKEGRPVSSLGFRGPQPVQKFLVGLLLGALMLIVSVLLLLVTGQARAVAPPAGAVTGLTAVIPALLLVVFHWVIQSSTEETVFRGYLVQMGALKLPGWLALLLPGVIFSLLHMVSAGLSEPVAILNILLFALFASFVALRQGSLWMVCGIHTGWNWFQGNIVGVPVSGQTPHLTSVFYFGPAEGASRFVSGGAFGPEASLVVSLVWGIAAFLAYRSFMAGRPSSVKARPERSPAS
jgi:membrane protease YdiL (CAAX protease family)